MRILFVFVFLFGLISYSCEDNKPHYSNTYLSNSNDSLRNKPTENDEHIGRNKSTESDEHIMPSYKAITLDKCGYYAIEKFEEHYGNPEGKSMGENYFDGNYKKFDTLIFNRVNDLAPNVWDNLSGKDKMQLWSFMYNSDSGDKDKYRWLAILDLVANKKMSEFDESYTMKIIGKKGSKDWEKAKHRVNSNTDWNSDKLKKMIDGQYKTYNHITYKKTWSYRPRTLEEMYNECSNTDSKNP